MKASTSDESYRVGLPYEKCDLQEHGDILVRAASWPFSLPALVAALMTILLLNGRWAIAEDNWPAKLYCDGGGLWRARLRIVVHNFRPTPLRGFPVVVPLGKGSGLPLAGKHRVDEIRVCDEKGSELLFAVRDGHGQVMPGGPIPEDAALVIPVECSGLGRAALFVYYDNPQAWPVPDFLERYPGVVNGDLEVGVLGSPIGWRHDEPTPTHRTFWTDETAHSGHWSLKTVVARGAKPTWIATRQQGIAIRGGVRYRLRAWVRAEDVDGFAGWYIHLGNESNPMIQGPVFSAGGGTYDWKAVEAEFIPPPEVNVASIGTVVWGTGTAWYDSVSLECLDPEGLALQLGCEERIELRILGKSEDGRLLPPCGGKTKGGHQALTWKGRATLRVVNTSRHEFAPCLVTVEANYLRAAFGRNFSAENILVTTPEEVVPSYLGSSLLFVGHVPPQSICHYYVYVGDATLPVQQVCGWAELVSKALNLVENPSFERNLQYPQGWSTSGIDGAAATVRIICDQDAPTGLGRCFAELSIPPGVPAEWRGLRQRVPVEGGKPYFVGGWVRPQDVLGNVRIHIHRRKSDGTLAGEDAITSVGPTLSGTQGWTLLSGIISTSNDTAFLEIHLTTNCPGTVHYDGLLVAPVLVGEVSEVQRAPRPSAPGITLWQVPAVMKVFPHSLPPSEDEKSIPAAIFVARNEWEALQLAIRSEDEAGNIEIEVDPPTSSSGDRLTDFKVYRCGFVPVDYPSSYYRATERAWERKIPRSPPSCDGWVGWWPDPLVPSRSLSVQRQQTESLWLIFRVPAEAKAGTYRGVVRLVRTSEQGEVKQVVAAKEFVVRVWDFALPQRIDFIAIYDVRFGPGGRWWRHPPQEMYTKLVEFLAARRLCPDMIHPAPRLRWVNGRVEADFTDFDRAAIWYFERLGLPVAYMPHDFYLFGWGLPPKTIAGVRPFPGEFPYAGVDRSALSPEYKQIYQALLKTFWEHIRGRGWHRKFVLYLADEPFADQQEIRQQFLALCRMIHEVYPEIPIYSSTWRIVDEWLDDLDVWGIGHYGIVTPEKMFELRQRGRRIWFTTDGQMCLDTPYCAVERLLPYYCFRYGAEGYEFWGVSWFTHDPRRFGWHAFIPQTDRPGHSYFVRYPNGDGYLVYPGFEEDGPEILSTVRLEQAREGVEDYYYLKQAAALVVNGNLAQKAPSLREKLRTALDAVLELVFIPNAGGRYSTKILPDPHLLEERRRTLGDALEEALCRLAE